MTDDDKNDKDSGAQEGKSSEAAVIQGMLAECGVEEYDSRVVGMLMDVSGELSDENYVVLITNLEVQFSLTSKMLEMASGLARHNQKQVIDAHDIHTVNELLGIMKDIAPDREKMIQASNEKNANPLPQIRHNYGLKLPNDRFCQLQPNLDYKVDGYELMDTSSSHLGAHQVPIFDPHQQQQQHTMLRPDMVQNILKRRAPEDDFDS